LRRRLGPIERELGDLEVPVTEVVPHELVQHRGRLVEAIPPEVLAHREVVAASRLSIHRSASPAAAWRPGGAPEPSRVEGTSRDAFQSLFPKLRDASMRSSLIRMSRTPGTARLASVKRNASVPKRSITSSGSTTFPFDFDIFWPSASRTSVWR